MDAPEGRETLAQYVPRHQRLYHVGRLDTDTEGLIILTNDGEFAHRLAHPSYEVRKTYLVDAEGLIDDRVLHRLEGLRLEDGPIRPDRVGLVSRGPSRTLVRITLHSGRNRIVRRMMDSVGHPVRRLARIGIGPVRLGDLASGGTRELTREELGTLLDLVGM